MFDLLVLAGLAFMGFFAIMNPLSSVSIFIALTENETNEEKHKIAVQSVLTAFIIIVIFAVGGHIILKIFGISFSALRLAGGILVAIIGYEMLHGKNSNINRPTKETIQETIKEEDSTTAITPLGMPLLAGPGTIITAMSFASGGVDRLLVTIIAFGLLCLITYFSFRAGEKIKDFLGTSALKVITRMMGLLLTVIGTQMFINGVYSAVLEFSGISPPFIL